MTGFIGRTDSPHPAEFRDFSPGDLPRLLELSPPSFSPSTDPLRQVEHLDAYVSRFPATSVLVEHHYIDRDFIDDYGLFYAKSLQPVPNHCRRVHFFRSSRGKVQEELSRIRMAGTPTDYLAACRKFSHDDYLGFTVIKPLQGSPVGRTILRAEAAAENGDQFGCLREYKAHTAGVILYVNGLPFQQQDLGVSACATASVWSALHMHSEWERSRTLSPVQITLFGNEHALPFGRALPSEGLSVDQNGAVNPQGWRFSKIGQSGRVQG